MNLQSVYLTQHNGIRASFASADQAAIHYATYVDFVTKHIPRGSKLLDFGCGSGWSTSQLAKAGFRTIGVDLNALGFEPAQVDFALVAGSGLQLPFANESFQGVASYQCLEHIPDPELALREMLRVLAPGGIVCILSPNLLSLSWPLRCLVLYSWRNRPVSTILFRRPGMRHDACGNTVPELLGAFCRSIYRCVKKSLAREPSFLMRDPDTVPPFSSDNDACYLSNPIDLVKFFGNRGCRILTDTAPGRPRWVRHLAAGTWVAAQKPVS